MEKLQKAGKCKAIGISNFSVKKTKDLLGYAKIKPAVQQIEIHVSWPFAPQGHRLSFQWLTRC